LRILFVVHGYPPDEAAGTELYTAGAARALAAAGHEVRVLAANPSAGAPTHRVERVDGVEVERLWTAVPAEPGGVLPLRDEAAERAFADALRSFAPHVVHVVSLIFLSERLVRLAREAAVPVVLAPTDFWFLCPGVHLPVGRRHPLRGRLWGLSCFGHTEASSPRWLAALARSGRLPARVRWHVRRATTLRATLRDAQLILTPCRFMLERFVEFGADARRIEALALGLEGPQDALPRKRRGPPRVGYLGAFTRDKGADLLVRAFREVDADAELVVRGHPIDEDYAAALHVAAAADARVAVGLPVPPGEVVRHLADLDLLVVPTRVHESFSRVAREAFVARTPVLASAAGALPEIVEPGRNGDLFRAGDARALASRLRTLLQGDALARLQSFPHVKTMEEHAAELVERYARVHA